MRDAVFYSIAHGIDAVFLLAAPAAAIVFGLAWLIKEIPLRGSAPTRGERSDPRAGARGLTRSYLPGAT